MLGGEWWTGYIPSMKPSTLALCSVGLLACFQPNLDKVQIICIENAADQCPEGQLCVSGLCASAAADFAVSLSDAGVDGGVDAAIADAAVIDLATPVGCRTAIAIPIPDLATCSTVSGFFAADQPAYWMGTTSQETCSTSVSNQLLYGCGTAGRSGAKLCGGLPLVIELTGVTWRSVNGTLGQVSNNSAQQGVLCCKAGQKAVGCAGAFAVGQAAQQCASGWAPCITLP